MGPTEPEVLYDFEGLRQSEILRHKALICKKEIQEQEDTS